MQLQLIIGHGEKSHHTLILNDSGPLQITTTMSTIARAWVLMLLLFVCFFWPSSLFLPSCNLVGNWKVESYWG
jgi:hypothetical protein